MPQASCHLKAVLYILIICTAFSQQLTAQFENRWQPLSNPTTKDLFKCFFLNDSVGWTVGAEGLIFKTTNSGSTWIAQQSGVNSDIREIFMLNASRGWALSFVQFVDTSTWWGATILRTTNGGETWTHQNYQPAGRYFHCILFRDSLNGWIGGESGDLLRTTDGGISWTPAIVDSVNLDFVAIVKIRFFTRALGFALGGLFDISGIVRRTTNGGERWVESEVSPEPTYDMHYIDSLNFIGLSGDFEYGAGLVRSRDAGHNWSYRWLGILGRPSTLSFRTPSEGWAPTELDASLMYTLDTGNTWHTIRPPRLKIIHDLTFVDSTTGYAVGDSGTVLKYVPVTSQVIDHGLFEAPESVTLFPNYPNPFNSSTQINYSLPRRSAVHLRVINPLGQTIKTIVADQIREAGLYRNVWDGQNDVGDKAASGVYFVQLLTSSSVRTRAMILMK
jgi:photosystem II stability/assembly factor-like uncharacterized protein